MELILAVIFFAFSACISPGPNNVMIMTSGMNYGTRRSLPHLLGISVGFPVMLICIGLGLGFIFDRYPAIHQVIKVCGIIYLLFLAWKIANATPTNFEADSTSKPFTFIQSALFQWVNPKAWFMATSSVATFTHNQSNVFLQVIMISFIFMVVVFPASGTWLVFGTQLKRVLKSAHHQKIFNICMAVILVASIIPVIFE
ncbi:MAG: LysE family translocator [Parashewanella sp.]